ncbi:MAG: hypothetical protein IJ770_02205 [Alphaproteobacteria bacterium]|nr:hypothetical protein [Alphaproteobacteria bacterium]
MKKFRFICLAIFVTVLAVQAYAAETDSADAVETVQSDSPDHLPRFDFIKIKKLPAEKDDLYDGAEIKPLAGTMSDAEKMQEENAGFEFNEDDKNSQPELLCSEPNLWKQVGEFIYKYVQNQSAKTVPERRAQLLLIRNLSRFEEIKEDALKNSFDASAAAMHLKMNEGREIYRMCVSKHNNSKRFEDVYVLIYPYITYYKVVVTNLAISPENLEDATFIYNW